MTDKSAESATSGTTERSDQSRSILRHGTIYFIGNILNRGAAFLLLPLYLHEFTAAEFGVYAVLQTVVAFVSVAAGLSLGWSIIQKLAMFDDQRLQGRYVGSALFAFAFISLLIVLLSFPLSYGFDQIFTKLNAGALGFQLAFLAAIGSAFFTLSIDVIQGWKRSIAFAIISIGKTILLVVLNLLCLFVFDLGVNGVIFSTFAATAILGFATFAYVSWNIPLSVSPRRSWQMTRLGAGITPGNLADNHLVSFDKIIVGASIGPEVAGFLALADRIAYLVRVGLVNPFTRIWAVDRLAIEGKLSLAKDFSFKPYALVFAMVCFLLITLTTLSTEIILIISDNEHLPARLFVGFMALSVMFYTFYHEFNFSLIGQGRGITIARIAFTTASFATIAYWVAAETVGAIAVAGAVSFAFALRAVLTVRAARKKSSVAKSEPMTPLLSILALSVTALGFGSWISLSATGFAYLPVKFGFLIAYTVALAVVLDRTMGVSLKNFARTIRSLRHPRAQGSTE